MNCPKCPTSKVNHPNAKFCQHCGTKLHSSIQKTQNEKTEIIAPSNLPIHKGTYSQGIYSKKTTVVLPQVTQYYQEQLSAVSKHEKMSFHDVNEMIENDPLQAILMVYNDEQATLIVGEECFDLFESEKKQVHEVLGRGVRLLSEKKIALTNTVVPSSLINGRFLSMGGNLYPIVKVSISYRNGFGAFEEYPYRSVIESSVKENRQKYVRQRVFSFSEKTIVIDNGSGLTKAGFGGEENPISVFGTVIGTSKHKKVGGGDIGDDIYIGPHAQAMRGICSLNYPIDGGIINNWDDMCTLWDFTLFEELQIEPNEYSLLMTESIETPPTQTEKICEVIFETFGLMNFTLENTGNLALQSLSRDTGLVIDIGDSTTQVIPIVNGTPVSHAMYRMELGGRKLADYLMRILRGKGYTFITDSEKEIARDIKEKLGYLSLDFEGDLEIADYDPDIEKSYLLPDGSTITLGSERFRCMEPLFEPSLLGIDYPGLDNIIINALKGCNKKYEDALLRNFLIIGGGAKTVGMIDRIKQGIIRNGYRPDNLVFREVGDQSTTAWNGGSIKASGFVDWITKSEYEETGAIIIKRCFPHQNFIKHTVSQEMYA